MIIFSGSGPILSAGFARGFRSLTAAACFAGLWTSGAAASSLAELAPRSPTITRILQRDRIVMGSGFKFKTFNTRNAATGENEGFFADIGKALAKRMLGDERKLEWRYASGTGEGNVRFVVVGEVDLIIDPVAETPFYRTLVGFSDEIFDSGSALLVRRGSPIRTIDDIKAGTRVIFDRSDRQIDILKAWRPEAAYQIYIRELDEFEALDSGAGDVFMHYLPHLFNQASRHPEYEVTGRFTHKPYGIASNKDDAVFLEYLNEFIRDFKASGEYARLYTKWFGALGGDNLQMTEAQEKIWSAPAQKLSASGAVDSDPIPISAKTSSTIAGIEQRGRIVIGAAFQGRAFNFQRQGAGDREGFMPDIARLLATKVVGDPRGIDWVFMNADALVGAMDSGVVDLVLDPLPLGKNAELGQKVLLSDEIFRSGPALLVRKGSSIGSIDHITRANRILFVSGQENDVRHIRRQAPEATFTGFPSATAALEALRKGEGDMMTDSLPVLIDLAAQDPGLTLVGRYASNPCSIISRKDDPVFGRYLTEFVRELKASGEHERLYQRWFAAYGANEVR